MIFTLLQSNGLFSYFFNVFLRNMNINKLSDWLPTTNKEVKIRARSSTEDTKFRWVDSPTPITKAHKYK